MVRVEAHLSLSDKKAKDLAHGKRVQLTAGELKHGSSHVKLHPEAHKKLMKARKADKGLRLGPLTDEEIMESGSLWSWIKGAASKVYKFGKDNWKDIKPILSTVADSAAQAYPQYSQQRGQLKQLTGIGVKTKKGPAKGSEEAKQRMAKVRAARGKKKTTESGSFKL